jgi:cystathionine beta-lyase/cystathionine gamma-synthase
MSEPRFTSYAHLANEERAGLRIPSGSQRSNIGIEDADGLIADIEQVLH